VGRREGKEGEGREKGLDPSNNFWIGHFTKRLNNKILAKHNII